VIYYGFIAPNIYISESRFLVRSPEHQSSTGLVGELLQSTGLSHSRDDPYSVRDYILSRDALKELDTKLAVRASYSKHDIASRIAGLVPGLNPNDSFEEFYRHFDKYVGVEYDPASAICILTVRAFTAKEAYEINNFLLEISEQLVNTLNDRSRQDLIHFADNEVRIASDKAKVASLALFNYRATQSVFEPDKQAALQLQAVSKIEEELVATEGQLSQLRKLAPNSPQIPALESRAETLRTAIASEASKVTSPAGSLSARAPNFERLTLDVSFADRQLGVALAELESARAEALQKQLYLERIVQPNLPDKAMEPRRFRSILTVFLMGCIAWGIATLLIASVREHAD
jgi:capsular polysaccharide transport system permease protein